MLREGAVMGAGALGGYGYGLWRYGAGRGQDGQGSGKLAAVRPTPSTTPRHAPFPTDHRHALCYIHRQPYKTP